MPAGTSKSAEYRAAINAFRGFASLYVVFYHLRNYTDFDWFGMFPPLRFGYIGVDFFFILSGLIVSHVYLQKSSTGGADFWKKFIWYRIARLFPVHLLVMILMLLAAIVPPSLAGIEPELDAQAYKDWFLLTFLVRQWTLPADYAWNSPAWSVSAELFAYIIVFPLIAYFTRGNISRSNGIMLAMIGAMLLLFMIWSTGTVNVKAYAGPLIRVTGGFVLGSGLYLILSSLPMIREWDQYLCFSLAGMVLILLIAPALGEAGLPVDMILIAALVVTISCTYLANGRTSAWLSRPGLFWLGEVSFALYLCHIPMMRVCRHMADRLDWDRGFWFGMLCVLASIGAAHLLYRLVEIPTRQLMRDWYVRFADRLRWAGD